MAAVLKGKILLIHDDPALMVRIIETLRPSGYRILLAFDNNQAWEIIAREQPDMIILDERLPQYKSLEMLQELRSNADISSIMVILITWCAADKEFPAWPDIHLGWSPDNRNINYAELLSFVKRLFRDREEGRI